MLKTVLWKENRKESFQRWLRNVNLGSIEGGSWNMADILAW